MSETSEAPPQTSEPARSGSASLVAVWLAMVAANRADIIPWGWGINGAFSVMGATLAVFIAMNWGFSVTRYTAAATCGFAALTLRSS